MTSVTTRAGKGSPLTNNEGDANFNNLNEDKLESQIANASGTNTITLSYSPTLSAYETDKVYVFKAANSNTGAVTLNIDSVGATAVVTIGGTALALGEILANQIHQVYYNGTNFRLINPYPKEPPSNHVLYNDVYRTNNEDTALNELDISTLLGVNSVSETFGPTGSGATNIWDAMDDMTSDANGVIVSFEGQDPTGTTLKLFAADGDATFTSHGNWDLVFSIADGSPQVGGAEVWIPVNTSQIFKMIETGDDAFGGVKAYYRGFTTIRVY